MSKSINWPLRIVWTLILAIVAAIFAGGLWYGLAYLAMTVIIPLDFMAHAFIWSGVGPAGGWLIIGCFVGGAVGYCRSLSRFGRKSESKKAVALAAVIGLFVWTVSFAASGFVEKKAQQKATAEKLAQAEQERRRIIEAEEEAALDKAGSEGRLWQMSSIRNQTGTKITFQLLNEKGNWDEFGVRPGAAVIVWEKVRVLTVRFDSSYVNGYQEKRYTLSSTPIIGHEPNKSDQGRAKSNSFKVSGIGVDLYQN
jgi:hypothetical protein